MRAGFSLTPRRLATQLVVVAILATITATALISVVFYFRARLVDQRITLGIVSERLSDVLSDLSRIPPGSWHAMVENHAWYGGDFSVDETPAADREGMTDEEQDIAVALAQELNLPEQNIRFRLERQEETGARPPDMDRGFGFDRRNRQPPPSLAGPDRERPDARSRRRPFPQMLMRVSVRVDDTQWLNARITRPIRAFTPRPFYLIPILSVGGIFILLGVLFTIRSITKPMRALAEAAERVGVGENVAPLPETGPEEIRETISAFNIMQKRLNAFIEDRTSMLAAISHDLRTPLTALRLHAEMVDDTVEREAIQRIVDTMTQMVEGTLDFSRDDVTREAPRPVDMAALVSGIVTDFEDMGRNVTLSDDFPDHLVSSCRSVAMTRAVTNLLRNAVTYGTAAVVSLEKSAHHYSIIIDDNGPGIPEDRMKDVFKPFVRLNEARDVDGGSGLGLSIVNSVAVAHGGRVKLSNRAGGGLRAEIVLPLVSTEA
ncbi:MAG: HAMP domain-containing protein [Methylobacteriaceae bacterium]|jgi:signal transduction histidine kinase|nr:HAMP domain-containing protein [Methylobacteriaceae bacterium]